MKRFTLLLIILVVFTSISIGNAQIKFGYVDSQKILAQYQEAVDAQNKLEQIRNQYQAEYEAKVREYQTLAQEIESQSLLLSEEKKQEKLRELQTKATEIDQYKYEKLNPEGGEFYRKNQELFKPIIDKINNIINKVGTEDEYDLILDASSGVILHSLPKYDLTFRVLDELNKTVSVSK